MRRGAVLLAAAVAVLASVPARAEQADVKALAAELLAKGALADHAPDKLKAAYALAVDELLPGIGGDDLARRAKDQSSLETMTHRAAAPGPDAHRAALAGVLCERLGSDTPVEARVWLLRMLQHVGRDESAWPVAGLLEDEEPRVRECARRALAANSADAAGEALRNALAKAATPPWRIALMNSAGYRRDAKAVAGIAESLCDANVEVAAAAAAALGKIATPEAAKALEAVLTRAPAPAAGRVADALLLCADAAAETDKDRAVALYQRLYDASQPARVRLAALRGLASADPGKALPTITSLLTAPARPIQPDALVFVREMPGDQATRAFAASLGKVPVERRPAMIDALSDRGDRAARPAVLAAAASDDENVRVAALKALGALGEAADVELLARKGATAGGSEGKAASDSLDRLPGADVDKAMLALLDKGQPRVRVELARSLGQRRAASATPKLMTLARGEDQDLRTAAIKALGHLAGAKELSALVAMLTGAAGDVERQVAADAVVAAVTRVSSDKDARAEPVLAAMKGASGQTRQALLGVLGRVEGAPAMKTLLAAADDADPEVQAIAVRALSGWSDAAPADALLKIAAASRAENVHVLALRGVVRLIEGDRRVKDDKKLAALRAAMDAARRPAERKLVLGGLSRIHNEQSLKTVAPFLDEKDLAAEAAAAAVEIARRMKLDAANVDAVRSALEKVVSSAAKDDTKKRAKEVLDKAAKIKPAGKTGADKGDKT